MFDTTLQIAVFGESNVGKSHYGAQLIGRLNAETGSMRMRGAAPDISAFDDVAQSLSGGVPGAHTAAGTYTETLLPILTEGNVAIDLYWPDYAGEQVSQLLEERRIPASWQQRVETADGWILMIRAKSLPLVEDIFSRPLGDLRSARPDVGVVDRSPQVRLVELLQMLLYTTHMRTGTDKPALVVLLTCWDELQVKEGTTPELVLNQKLPLLAAFIRNNWIEPRRLVLGLSATEVTLSKDSPNQDFINKGAEQMGWVVSTDGTLSKDLTSPVSLLAQAIQI